MNKKLPAYLQTAHYEIFLMIKKKLKRSCRTDIKVKRLKIEIAKW